MFMNYFDVGSVIAMTAIRRLFHLAASLTGQAPRSRNLPSRISNRRQLLAAFERAVQHNVHTSSPALLALLVLDIDRFRQVNFSLGYAAGDRFLQEITARLQISGSNLVLARSGDDEFALLLQGDSPEALQVNAEHFRQQFTAPFVWNGQPCYLNASMGLSEPISSASMTEAALIQAEQALLAAKHSGKNKLVPFEHIHRHRSNQLIMEAELRGAIEHNELMLYYQPRLELSSGRIVCLEALVRWKHPVLGMIPPNDFIPLAEETGLILPLGEWVLREACLQRARWHESGLLDYQVAVNVSPCQFQDEHFADKAIHIIDRSGVDPSFLEFEITESSIMQNMEKTVAVLDKLTQKGISISIDDFGIGYSSLSYLKQFPIHCLKIDRSFVKNIQTNQSDLAITNAIINLGHALNLQVVAEGVEEVSQLDILRETTCTTIQGYLLSPPISVAEIEHTYSAHNAQPVMIS
ncbi:bifunctional diguanylate cyclase/phosphodiesterase [Paenibacillus whitsoniae]|uniref:Bifunctional diguanylate cyclase/phosphodiesterase n=2 Tax=Paenibacillus whitsoniae TaxID=2496558 RepID=A0A430JJQ9_9BACL|nr:bifunctional diguanylate cyclase/phosphodiesterase [Paenibacillus whitsoniae]